MYIRVYLSDQLLRFFCRGWSAISPGEKHIVVLNLFDGLNFYSIADRTLSYSVHCPINQQKNVPVPVLFNNDGSAIILGGMSGSMRVLDSSSCETLQVLSHDGQFFSSPGVVFHYTHKLSICTGDLIQAIVHASDSKTFLAYYKPNRTLAQPKRGLRS